MSSQKDVTDGSKKQHERTPFTTTHPAEDEHKGTEQSKKRSTKHDGELQISLITH